MRVTRRAFLGTALATVAVPRLSAAEASVTIPEPEWVNYPPVRAKGNYRTAARVDTECHLRAGHLGPIPVRDRRCADALSGRLSVGYDPSAHSAREAESRDLCRSPRRGGQVRGPDLERAAHRRAGKGGTSARRCPPLSDAVPRPMHARCTGRVLSSLPRALGGTPSDRRVENLVLPSQPDETTATASISIQVLSDGRFSPRGKVIDPCLRNHIWTGVTVLR